MTNFSHAGRQTKKNTRKKQTEIKMLIGKHVNHASGNREKTETERNWLLCGGSRHWNGLILF